MIDLDELERVCNFLMATGRHNQIPNNMVAENVKELITRLRQAENDAARYREIAMDAHGIFVASGDNEAADAVYEAVIDVRNN